MERARQACERLREAGLSELNLSTGRDHQDWVSQETVLNAAEAAVHSGIRVLITVETDTPESHCLAAIRSDSRVAALVQYPSFGLQANYWMPFHGDAPARQQSPDLEQLRKGCSQIFNNVVVNPRDEISACCGLTFEHIPEMHLGKCSGTNLAETYSQQEHDFLKHWLKVDGPYSIIERLLGNRAEKILAGVVHQCQACAILHQDPEVRAALEQRHTQFVPDVMTRHAIGSALQRAMQNAGEVA